MRPCTETVYLDRKATYVTYPTYRELKKHIPTIFEKYKDRWGDKLTELHIFRSRRGEWGEWYEIWKPYGNKYKIVKQGWQ